MLTPEGQAPEHSTVVTQTMTGGAPAPWLSRHLTAVITLGLTMVVCVLALRGDRDAIE